MTKRQQAHPEEGPVSWVAGPFGDCIRACPGSRHCKIFAVDECDPGQMQNGCV